MMTIDIGVLQFVALLLLQAIAAAGAYWKLQIQIKDRPVYTKVEEMIKRDTLTEEKVYKMIEREAFPKTDGHILAQRLTAIEEEQKKSYLLLEKISQQLQDHIAKSG